MSLNVTIQREVIATALANMLTKGYFDICTIDSILRMTGGIPDGDAYNALRVLHCVNFRDMSPRPRLPK